MCYRAVELASGTVLPKKAINLRFNYAWGKNSHEAYFFIGEAF
jgi:hypothetical protein